VQKTELGGRKHCERVDKHQTLLIAECTAKTSNL